MLAPSYLAGSRRMKTVTIAAQFNGPPGSGNGGYSCGVAASFIDGPAEATLRAPPPLETPLDVHRDGERVMLMHGETLVAEARPARIDWSAPQAPTLTQAKAAEKRYRGYQHHFFPGCFTCGTARRVDDGLRIFTGPVENRDVVATDWTPSDAFADASGRIKPEFIWAALDCPTYWAHANIERALLARLTLAIDTELPRANEPLIIAAWPLSSEGRKHTSGAALYRTDGSVIARAQALWIDLKT